MLNDMSTDYDVYPLTCSGLVEEATFKLELTGEINQWAFVSWIITGSAGTWAETLQQSTQEFPFPASDFDDMCIVWRLARDPLHEIVKIAGERR